MIRDLQPKPLNHQPRPPKQARAVIILLYLGIIASLVLLGKQAVTSYELLKKAKDAEAKFQSSQSRIQAAHEKAKQYSAEQGAFKDLQRDLDKTMRPDTILAWIPTTLTPRQRVTRVYVTSGSESFQVALNIENNESDPVPEPGEFNAKLEKGILYPPPRNYSFQPAMINTTGLGADGKTENFQITYALKHSLIHEDQQAAAAAPKVKP